MIQSFCQDYTTKAFGLARWGYQPRCQPLRRLRRQYAIDRYQAARAGGGAREGGQAARSRHAHAAGRRRRDDAFGFPPWTVCYRYRKERQVPDLRLSGQWLEQAGFDRGRKFQIQVHTGRLTLRAEPTVEH